MDAKNLPIRAGWRRLLAAEYDLLRSEILHRDGWRCQHCGGREHLQVHHQLLRARGGPDIADNLITLCAEYHRQVHLCSASGK